MKKSLNDLLDQTDAEMLGDFADGIRAEEVESAVVSRIQEKVTGGAVSVERPRKRWRIPALAAACAAIAIVVVWGTGLLQTADPTIPDPVEVPAPFVEKVSFVHADCGGTALDLKQSDDRFISVGMTGEGSFVSVSADRESYVGIRFYESEGKTYMIYAEGLKVYAFDGNTFRSTGVIPAEMQFFSQGAQDGYTYVGGVFHCAGGYERGLFRVDLSNGSTEQVIDTAEIVTKVAINGDKIYYTTCQYRAGDVLRYSLKCADFETNEISVLLESDDAYFGGLKIIDNVVCFHTKNAVCWITQDHVLHTLEVKEPAEIWNYCILGDTLYVYESTRTRNDGGDAVITRMVYAYGEDGTLKGRVSDTDKRFVGASCDDLVVYDSRIVAFDEDGFYLLDVASGKYEKIASFALLRGDAETHTAPEFRAVSKAVYVGNGKLYLQYGNRVLEYGFDSGTRTFVLED